MTVKFTQISPIVEPTPTGGSIIHLYALDENGQIWERMRNTWGKVKHPEDNSSGPGIRML